MGSKKIADGSLCECWINLLMTMLEPKNRELFELVVDGRRSGQIGGGRLHYIPLILSSALLPLFQAIGTLFPRSTLLQCPWADAVEPAWCQIRPGTHHHDATLNGSFPGRTTSLAKPPQSPARARSFCVSVMLAFYTSARAQWKPKQLQPPVPRCGQTSLLTPHSFVFQIASSRSREEP